MTTHPSGERCEDCVTRLDRTRPWAARRCVEHRDQVALFALDDLTASPRPRRSRPRRGSRPIPNTKD